MEKNGKVIPANQLRIDQIKVGEVDPNNGQQLIKSYLGVRSNLGIKKGSTFQEEYNYIQRMVMQNSVDFKEARQLTSFYMKVGGWVAKAYKNPGEMVGDLLEVKDSGQAHESLGVAERFAGSFLFLQIAEGMGNIPPLGEQARREIIFEGLEEYWVGSFDGSYLETTDEYISLMNSDLSEEIKNRIRETMRGILVNRILERSFSSRNRSKELEIFYTDITSNGVITSEEEKEFLDRISAGFWEKMSNKMDEDSTTVGMTSLWEVFDLAGKKQRLRRPEKFIEYIVTRVRNIKGVLEKVDIPDNMEKRMQDKMLRELTLSVRTNEYAISKYIERRKQIVQAEIEMELITPEIQGALQDRMFRELTLSVRTNEHAISEYIERRKQIVQAEIEMELITPGIIEVIQERLLNELKFSFRGEEDSVREYQRLARKLEEADIQIPTLDEDEIRKQIERFRSNSPVISPS